MAKNTVEIDVKVDDKGSTKKVALGAKKAAEGLDKTAVSAGQADRNIKGVGQASSGAGKNFSKMSQGMGGLVGTYATLAATVFAVSAAFQFLKSASDFRNLLEGQKALGAVTGVTYASMTRSIAAATDGQLKYADAAKAAAIGTAAGLSPSQLNALGNAAKVTSIALGRDLGDSFDRLVRGVTKAEPELLDELGIILRLEAATTKYGLKIGKAAGDLNEFERSQAVANEVLEQAQRKFGMMEKMMDPNAAALNRFSVSFDKVVNSFKVGIAGPLTAVFEFLSTNIYALVGLLSIFATSVLKDILPNMQAWKASSISAGDTAKASLLSTQLEIKATAAEYERLNALQNRTIAGAKASLASTFGGDKNASATTTGKGGMDFLSGNVDNKTAEANAKKAIAHYDMQTAALGKSLKERTGLLKEYSIKEIATAKVNMAVLAGERVKDLAGWKRWGVALNQTWTITVLKWKSTVASIKAGFAAIATAASRAGAVIGKAFFWLSIASIAWDLLKAAKAFFFPISEASKKLADTTTALTEKYTLLNEELNRTVTTMNDFAGAAYTLSEQTTARANAIQGLDVPAFLAEAKHLDLLSKSSEEYKVLRAQLVETAKAAMSLDGGFTALYTEMRRDGKISKKASENSINLSNSMKEGRIALDQMPAALQGVSAEYLKLVGTFKKPFAFALIGSLETSVKTHKTALGAMQATQDQLLRDMAAVPGRVKSKEIVPMEAARIIAGLRAQIDAGAAAIGLVTDEMKAQETFAKHLTLAQTGINKLVNDKLDAEKTYNKELTAGITLADKRTNITLKNDLLQYKKNDSLAAEAAIQAKINAILEDTKGRDMSKEEDASLASARQALKVQEDKTEIIGFQVDLEKLRNKIIDDGLALEQKLVENMNKRVANSGKLLEDARKLRNIQTGVAGLGFGVEAKVAETRQLRSNMDTRQTAAVNDQTIAQTTFDDLSDRSKLAEPTASAAQVRDAQAQLDISKNTVLAINDEIAAYDRRGQALLEHADADTKSLQIKLQNLSINPALTRFREIMQANKEKDIVLSQKEQKMLYAQIEAQTLLNQALEVKSGIFSSLTDNISSAFGSIVDGTKSAKQAFGDMAIAILKDISQMIIRMMVMRLLMSAFGPMFSGGGTPATGAGVGALKTGIPAAGGFLGNGGTVGVATGGGFNLIPGGRDGGMFSAGKKLPGYATGGIAKGSGNYSEGGIAAGRKRGYPVTLHGTEAVVPLPNGKSIPVDMQNAGAQNNNSVVVNVSMDSSGTSSDTGAQKGADMGNLGNAIAQAVQQELQNQKRSGGILNPYGVA